MEVLGHPPAPKRQWAEELCLVVDDWTTDIDTPFDVEHTLPKLDAHVREEASTPAAD
jgi:hypothetical protein